MYSYMREIWKAELHNEVKVAVKTSGGVAQIPIMRARLMAWRRGPAIVRIERPTRLDRARRLGWRPKQGIIVVRVRVRRGPMNRPRPRSGRRPKRMGVYGYTTWKSLQQIAEERAARKYPNMEVLGSYWVGDDGMYRYFEVILVDPNHPAIRRDPKYRWLSGYEIPRSRRARRLRKQQARLIERLRKRFGVEPAQTQQMSPPTQS